MAQRPFNTGPGSAVTPRAFGAATPGPDAPDLEELETFALDEEEPAAQPIHDRPGGLSAPPSPAPVAAPAAHGFDGRRVAAPPTMTPAAAALLGRTPPPAPPAPAAGAPGAAPSRRPLVPARARGAGRAVRASARRAAPFVVGAAAMLVALLVFNQVSPPPPPLSRTDVNEAIRSALASQTPAPAQGVGVFAVIAPSVVLIQANVPGAPAGQDGRLGTGTVVSAQGLILTSNHVIAGSTRIQVTFADGSKAAAQIVSQTPENDTAMISAGAPPQGVTPAVLGNPNRIRVGDEAYVVGSPFGLYGSLSTGVISALDRSFDIPDTDITLSGLIQVDAAVNPGNSGGPLVNRQGQVIGVVAALINPTKEDVFVGIGLAVPITSAGGGLPGPAY